MNEPEYVETEYTLEVCCDHLGPPEADWDRRLALHPGANAPLRVVSLVYYLPKPPDTWGFHCWREAQNPQDPAYPEALQTYFGRLIELKADEETMRDPRKRDQLVTNRKTGEVLQGTNWRFWCSDCDDTLPLRQATIEPIFEGLRTMGRSTVTLEELRDYVARR